MTFKQPLLPSLTLTDSNNPILSNKSDTCKVCGQTAHIKYYGVLSCQSCKIFFRRNGFRSQTVRPCPYNSHCEVDISSRNVCPSCRLEKCFAAGMSTDLIRKIDLNCKTSSSSPKLKSKQTQVLKHDTVMTVSQLPVLNLLRDDISSFTTSDWTLFSNVVHAYDTFCMVSTLNNILQIVSLPSNEACFSEACAFETIGSIYTFMQSFVNCTPDFQVLTINEQQSLLQRNLHGIVGFCSVTVFRDSGFLHNPECFHGYEMAYGLEPLNHALHIINRLDFDTTLLKLILMILVFSSNCFIVDVHDNMYNDSLRFGTFRLLGSQNVYVELLWKYMIHRYGYCETVIRFSGLIIDVLNLINRTADVYITNDRHHHFVDTIVETTKQTLYHNQNNPVVLWGKTL